MGTGKVVIVVSVKTNISTIVKVSNVLWPAVKGIEKVRTQVRI